MPYYFPTIKMGVIDLVFELWASKAKVRGVLFTGSLVTMVTYYVKIINESYLAIITLYNVTILLSFRNIEWSL